MKRVPSINGKQSWEKAKGGTPDIREISEEYNNATYYPSNILRVGGTETETENLPRKVWVGDNWLEGTGNEPAGECVTRRWGTREKKQQSRKSVSQVKE